MLVKEKTKLSETRSLLEKEVAKHQATKSELKSEVSRFKVIIEDLNLEKQNHQITKSKLDDLVINNVLKSAVTKPKLVQETSQNNFNSPTVLPVIHDLLKSNQSTIAKPKSVQEKSQNNLGQNRLGHVGQNNLSQNNLGQNNLSMIREERSRSVSPNEGAWPPHGKFQRDRWKYNQGDTSKTAKSTSSLGKNSQENTSKTQKNTASPRKYGPTWTNI